MPQSFKWNPLVNIEVTKKTGMVSRYLTWCHQSREVVEFKDNKTVSEFVNKYKDTQTGEDVPLEMIYSRDGYENRGEKGTIIYPLLMLCGHKISCLILDDNLFKFDCYQLKAILKFAPSLTCLSIKSGGDDDHREEGEFPCLKNLKWVELVSHYYCGLPKNFLEAYGTQLKSLALQDLDSQSYNMPPGGKDSLNRMVKGFGEIEGMFKNVEELKLYSLRNLSVLTSLASLNSPSWNLKRLSVNVTMPNEEFNFSHFQMILNRFSESLEEVHLDVFGFHKFVEAFYDWEVVQGRDYPEEALPRKVCSKLRVLSLPCLVLKRFWVLEEAMVNYFPKLETLNILRWERKWPMRVQEYLGRPQKRDLARIFKGIKKGALELKEVRVLKCVSMEKEEDIAWSKKFEKKEAKKVNAKAKGRGGGKTKN